MDHSKNHKMKELERIAFLEMPTEHEAKHCKVVACGAKIDYTYIASYYLCEALKVVSRGTQYQDICKKIVEAAEKIIEDEGC